LDALVVLALQDEPASGNLLWLSARFAAGGTRRGQAAPAAVLTSMFVFTDGERERGSEELASTVRERRWF
jgi:hypothetical protein